MKKVLLCCLMLSGCAVPDNERFTTQPSEARRHLAETLTTLKGDPAAASRLFAVSHMTDQINRSRPASEQVTAVAVATELVALFATFKPINEQLPNWLPPTTIFVSRFTEDADGLYEMVAHVGLDNIYTVTLRNVHGQLRIIDIKSDFSIVALVSGRLSLDEHDPYDQCDRSEELT